MGIVGEERGRTGYRPCLLNLSFRIRMRAWHRSSVNNNLVSQIYLGWFFPYVPLSLCFSCLTFDLFYSRRYSHVRLDSLIRPYYTEGQNPSLTDQASQHPGTPTPSLPTLPPPPPIPIPIHLPHPSPPKPKKKTKTKTLPTPTRKTPSTRKTLKTPKISKIAKINPSRERKTRSARR